MTSNTGTPSPQNPYVIAILAATLAGFFSVVGGYFAASFHARHAIAQKRFEYRVEAYGVFLDKISRNKIISQLISIGGMADHLATDSEIQDFEDRIGQLLKRHDAEELYWRLDTDLNILRLYGTIRVIEICDDILKALVLRDEEIEWKSYSPEIVAFHNEWKMSQQKGVAYGWEERISVEERLMVVTIAKLTQALINQLRLEIQQ